MQCASDQVWEQTEAPSGEARAHASQICRHAGFLVWLQVDDSAFDANEALMERLLVVDDVDAVHTNCAGLA